ncbi:hypothetical protein N7532_007600 [Penicillium argentinense]|uniref:Uncharacterized protein n=1 Tax=Penicillium argentinense TaxID=1131581 RepID=A0A9W9EHR2_9EURO|nr:uncharacterized protein N7532_011008 [Penicillium argentinense]XP_056473459.1 uncharacterized protein N7532_007600 [Penicillium argentinense]KAJ5081965.1 hypothetical protein N7532_011008 [Penicillium argentinense]KAJ5095309.1 hypothetical protein N7532_007600 [Penicillium argentinense]
MTAESRINHDATTPTESDLHALTQFQPPALGQPGMNLGLSLSLQSSGEFFPKSIQTPAFSWAPSRPV